MANTKKEATILLVDDVAENLKMIAKKLKDDYNIIITTSGKNALEYLKDCTKKKPDLILLDVMMPEMDGYTVCEMLKNIDELKKIPVIFITGMHDEEAELRALEAGGADFVTRPFSFPIVKARIKNQLRIIFQQKYLEDLVKARTKEIINTQLSYMSKIGLQVKEKDEAFIKHIKRVSHYSYILCKKYGLDEKTCDIIFYARQIQGLGRTKKYSFMENPDDFIENQNEDENLKMGYEVFEEYSEKILEVSKNIAVYENEKWDGKGYPNGLKRVDIPIEARISSICNHFDIWTKHKDKEKRVEFDDAIKKMEKESGRTFDPVLVNLFIEETEAIKKVMENFNHED